MAVPSYEPGPLDLRHPFSRADARSAGLSETSLLGPRYQKIFHDRYVASGVGITLPLRAEVAVELAAPPWDGASSS
jgi:hypothetical protein